jgi:hypothetical protein
MNMRKSKVRALGCAVSAVLLVLTGCGTAVPPAGWARDQAPVAGSPAGAWRTSQGRCVVVTPFTRLSCRLLVRHAGPADLRLTLLADEGPVLLDGSVVNGMPTIHGGHPDLLPRGTTILSLAHAAWGPLPTGEPVWHHGHWLLHDPHRVIHLGGDPLLPRLVEQDGLEFSIGDYRSMPTGLLAHRASLQVTGFEITLVLGTDTEEILRDAASSRKSPPP